MDINTFYQKLWQDYIQLTPQAQKIHQAVLQKNDHIINDHVAFRTFNQSPVSLKNLEPLLLSLGYKPLAPYHFEQKKLDAWGYIHEDSTQPRVFLSELKVELFSANLQQIVHSLCQQVETQSTKSPNFFYQGRPWSMPTWQQYQDLLAESEYAAWLSVIGFRANHFTISVNALNNTTELEAVLDLVESVGMSLNESGGRVKGTPKDLLVQGSTLADRKTFKFSDGQEHEIPTCYYEFAKRYPDPSGQLYQGFVAASADKIFESTNK